MGDFAGDGKVSSSCAVALVLDVANAFEPVESSSGLGLSDALQFPKEDIKGAMRVLRAPEASAVWWLCGGAAKKITLR